MSGIAVLANGRRTPAPEGATVSDLLAEFRLAESQVVVEFNGEPLERSRYRVTRLHEGDRIEIAQMVGGG
jgi:thiamine biosynthesis protein ThiS